MSSIVEKMKSDNIRLHKEISRIIDGLPSRIDRDQLVPGTTYKLSSVIRDSGVIVAEIDLRITVN